MLGMFRYGLFVIVVLGALAVPCMGRQYHVAMHGDDAHAGSLGNPLRTISAAARLAQPGDTIIVHEGTYRERINPPRGGVSDQERITYMAAPGANVTIKGSQIIRGWEPAGGDAWKVVIDNALFGDFNPFSDVIAGDWFHPQDRTHVSGAVYLDEHWLMPSAHRDEVLAPIQGTPLWYAQVGETHTTIWAQFGDANPNEALVEINVRQSVFYPERPGINYLTVRGFTMMHAATPWAPPTAEQIGLIGTHWSKGWIIEHNDIRYSTCTGITLGKYGDAWDNTSQDTAEGYVDTIERALAAGWSKRNIGHHIVRHNRIAHCEQAGIVGSMGAAFSIIHDNVIHDIHVRRLFSGYEQAGIKLHAPIDVLISRNHVFRAARGIWLDWMTQGTRVTANLLHDNDPGEDLFLEVNHGPFMIDHNILLSDHALSDWSQGGAYAHNLFAGRIEHRAVLDRRTPYHEPHSTRIIGLHSIEGGDSRFYNNIVAHREGLRTYDEAARPMHMAGNVYVRDAAVSAHEQEPVMRCEIDPDIALIEQEEGLYLAIRLDENWSRHPRALVTTELLGRAVVPNLPYLKPDGSVYRLDHDYRGVARREDNPFPGPFEVRDDDAMRFPVRP